MELISNETRRCQKTFLRNQITSTTMADRASKSDLVSSLVQRMKAGEISKEELFVQLSRVHRQNQQVGNSNAGASSSGSSNSSGSGSSAGSRGTRATRKAATNINQGREGGVLASAASKAKPTGSRVPAAAPSQSKSGTVGMESSERQALIQVGA